MAYNFIIYKDFKGITHLISRPHWDIPASRWANTCAGARLLFRGRSQSQQLLSHAHMPMGGTIALVYVQVHMRAKTFGLP